MRTALKRAFEAASRLPEPAQERLAAAILDEIEADELWDEALSESAEALGQLADEALTEHRAGRTNLLDPDRL